MGKASLRVGRRAVRLGFPLAALLLRPHPSRGEEPGQHVGKTQAEPAAARPHIGHVLIISEDGLRGDAVAKLHLHWHELLRRRGAWSYRAMTIRDASTLPAHASMLSGVDTKVHGLTWNN